MKEYVEKMIKEYPDMKFERSCLMSQMKSCKINDEDVIYSMCFSHPEGERVQTSGISDKTAKVALSFRDRKRRMEEERYNFLFEKYQHLDEEISFLESTIADIPGELGEIMSELVIEGDTWEEVCFSHCIGIHKLSDMRKQGIKYLIRAYQRRESMVAAYLLS